MVMANKWVLNAIEVSRFVVKLSRKIDSLKLTRFRYSSFSVNSLSPYSSYTSLLSSVSLLRNRWLVPEITDEIMSGFFKLPRLDITVCKGLIPLISCNVLGLAFVSTPHHRRVISDDVSFSQQNTYCLRASFFPRPAFPLTE